MNYTIVPFLTSIKSQILIYRYKCFRCSLSNGRTVWLCQEHSEMPQVTILSMANETNHSDALSG